VLVEKFEDTKWVIRSRKSKEKIIQWPQEMFEDTKGVITSRKSKEKIIQWPQKMFEDTYLQTFLVAIVLFSPLIYGL
jgi:hypoxanthine phosphoribosyltransferase